MKRSEKMGTLWECGPCILLEYTPTTQDLFPGPSIAPSGFRELFYDPVLGIHFIGVRGD